MNAIIKLQSMIDKTLYYRNKKAVIRSFENLNDEYELIIEIDGVPQRFLKTNEEKLSLFLANFSEVETVEEEPSMPANTTPATIRNEEANLYAENKQTFANLSQILLSDIEKIRAEPDYVKQAKQISNSVNTLVNLTKLQLQLLKSR